MASALVIGVGMLGAQMAAKCHHLGARSHLIGAAHRSAALSALIIGETSLSGSYRRIGGAQRISAASRRASALILASASPRHVAWRSWRRSSLSGARIARHHHAASLGVDRRRSHRKRRSASASSAARHGASAWRGSAALGISCRPLVSRIIIINNVGGGVGAHHRQLGVGGIGARRKRLFHRRKWLAALGIGG